MACSMEARVSGIDCRRLPMLKQMRHAVLPESDHDEGARQDFVVSFKRHVQNSVLPGTTTVYERIVLPRFRRESGRDPQTRHEIRRAMEREPYYQMSTVLQREGQGMLWQAVLDTVERQLPGLIDRAKRVTRGKTKGTLSIAADYAAPDYLLENHHHLVPGGYAEERAADDVAAGALYDRGAFLYVGGYFGPRMDGLGRAMVTFLKRNYPHLRPRRILDMGCTAGGSSVALKEAYPDAEVYGIDAGAPCVRYAHPRAESLGVAVHFSAQNAEGTSLPDDYFDLVVSTAMLHETATRALQSIVRESRRVLKPGGLMVHAEQPQYEGVAAWEQFVRDWDTNNNAEPFWGTLHDTDLVALAEQQGFARTQVFQVMGPSSQNVIQQAPQTSGPQGKVIGRPGGNGLFYFGATK
ncbi:MAG: class I SAM-dependent methyltransferase [Alphaproteobacteria bacterium]|nr:class I SAM-dependent methyltransferase [Alphaproteobacteria bacterium]